MTSLSSSSPSTSASLIERARDADGAAWGRLTAIDGPLVYRWCRQAGLQEADSADVMQEVFRAVLGGLDSFEPDRSGGFRGWLYGVSRHKLADHFRTSRDEAELPPSLAADLESSGTHDQRAIEQAITRHAALGAIRGDFDEHNWQAFERTVLGHEATTDVATDLGTSTAAVRQARFRILRRLRRELDGTGER